MPSRNLPSPDNDADYVSNCAIARILRIYLHHTVQQIVHVKLIAHIQPPHPPALSCPVRRYRILLSLNHIIPPSRLLPAWSHSLSALACECNHTPSSPPINIHAQAGFAAAAYINHGFIVHTIWAYYLVSTHSTHVSIACYCNLINPLSFLHPLHIHDVWGAGGVQNKTLKMTIPDTSEPVARCDMRV